MDLDASMLPEPLALCALVAAAMLAAVCLHGARRDEALREHAWPGMLVLLLVLWQMRAVTDAGPALHLLGAALLQLCFGWRLAVLGLTVVIAAHTANGAGAWLALGVNVLLMAALPVAVSHAVTRAVNRRAPGEPFAYILIAGFAGAGLAMAAVLAASTGLLLAAGSGDPSRLLEQYALSGILVVFPEAFVTGMLIAPLAMFYPQAVATWTPPWETRGQG